MSIRLPTGPRLRALFGTLPVAMALSGCHGDSTAPVDTPAVASVEVSPDSVSIPRGTGVQLTARVLDEHGVVIPGLQVTWATSDSAVATVSSSGLVSTVGLGRAVVTATSEGHSGTAVVLVETPAVASVEVSPDSVSVPRGSSVQLTARVLDQNGVVIPGLQATWATSDSAVAKVSLSGLVSTVGSGRAVVTATCQGHTGVAVVLVESIGLDYAIVDAQFTQGVQAADGSIPMVLHGNGAVLNVLMSATPPSSANVPLVLRLYDEDTQGVIFVDTATTSGTLGTDASYETPTVQFLVPPSVLRPRLAWQVVRDPGGGFPDDSTSNDVFPRSGPVPLATVDVPTFKLRFVPIVLTAHGNATGNVTSENLDQYTRVLLSVYPLGSVDIQVGTPLATSASFGAPPQGGASSFWIQVLQELDLARVADPDASDAHWYGVVRPPSGFNYTYYGGWAYIPSTAAGSGPGTRTAVGVQVGWFSVESQARDNVAHELGHNFGRYHSPCGNPAGVDPNYPVAGGFLDRPGHDVFGWTRGFTDDAPTIPVSTGDVMGYCHPAWASVYTYRGVLQFRSLAAAAPLPVTKVLYVRGLVTSFGVRLDPAFTLDAHPTPVAATGQYHLDGLAADGSILFTRSFDPAVMDHAPAGEATFAVAVPLTPDQEGRLETLRVQGPAGEAVRSRAPTRAPSQAPVGPPQAVREPSGMVRVSCDARTSQAILIQDTEGRLLATAPSAATQAEATPGATLTVGCSDGVSTATFQVIAP